ncbi:Hypothetical predicted protein [Lecanosticta acicola]|uniref:Uncharacterized protein n=1 Tax=Lecanosticta acicola TaxID=111012 RepID=A0AAI9ECY5_9PEZI|nr:Hypothetical predicted protein [Lecanosticta acicola]
MVLTRAGAKKAASRSPTSRSIRRKSSPGRDSAPAPMPSDSRAGRRRAAVTPSKNAKAAGRPRKATRSSSDGPRRPGRYAAPPGKYLQYTRTPSQQLQDELQQSMRDQQSPSQQRRIETQEGTKPRAVNRASSRSRFPEVPHQGTPQRIHDPSKPPTSPVTWMPQRTHTPMRSRSPGSQLRHDRSASQPLAQGLSPAGSRVGSSRPHYRAGSESSPAHRGSSPRSSRHTPIGSVRGDSLTPTEYEELLKDQRQQLGEERDRNAELGDELADCRAHGAGLQARLDELEQQYAEEKDQDEELLRSMRATGNKDRGSPDDRFPDDGQSSNYPDDGVRSIEGSPGVTGPRDRIAKLEKELEDCHEHGEDLKALLEQRDADLEEAKKLKSEHDRLKEKVEVLEQQNEILSLEKDELQEKLDESDPQLEDLPDENLQLSIEMDRMREDLDLARNNNAEAEPLEEKDTEIAELKETIRKKEDEIDDLQEQLGVQISLGGGSTVSRANGDYTSEENERLQDRLDEQQHIVNRLESELELYRGRTSDAEANAGLENTIRDLEFQLQECRDHGEKLEDQVGDLDYDLKDAKNEISRLQRQLRHVEGGEQSVDDEEDTAGLDDEGNGELNGGEDTSGGRDAAYGGEDGEAMEEDQGEDPDGEDGDQYQNDNNGSEEDLGDAINVTPGGASPGEEDESVDEPPARTPEAKKRLRPTTRQSKHDYSEVKRRKTGGTSGNK